MNREKKGVLLVYLICFIISLGFTILTTLNMIEVWRIQKDVAGYLGVPFTYDPFILIFILFTLLPTLFFLGMIFKTLKER